MKKKCLFIDHKYHSTTSSTRFLMDILSKEYTVDVLYLEDFSENSLSKILNTPAELYLAFQYDFLAPFLLSNNKKVLIVPMYDGTGEMHPTHWLAMRGGLFLNFSEYVHNTHIGLGLNSMYTRYYPDPNNYPKFNPSTATGNSIFFWERHPNSGFSIDWLAFQLNKQNMSWERAHIHQASDPGQYSKRHSSLIKNIFPGKIITTSNWFQDKSEFLNYLSKFGIFIAPRKAEGIGFSFIDAMACGMVVFAHDKPTMNEYIEDGKTGFVFDEDLPNLHTLNLEKIRQESLRVFAAGHDNWLQFIPILLSKIDIYINAPQEQVIKPMSATLGSEIANAFFSNNDVYLSLVQSLVFEIKGNEIWRRRTSKQKFSTKMMIKFKDHPVLAYVLMHLYSKRRKIF